MANGQPDELIAPTGKVRIVADHERASASAHYSGEGRIDVVLVAGFHDMELQSTRSCCRLQVCGNRLGIGTGWVHKCSDGGRLRNELVQKFQLLRL